MVKLLVNNQIITLPAGEVVQLTKAAARLGELQNRQGVVSTDFDVPMTAENLAALGYPSTVGINFPQLRPGLRVDAVLIQNEIEVSRGAVQLVEVDYIGRVVRLSFFGGNSDWVGKMGGMKLSDINLEDLNHEYTAANIVDSWDNTEGYIYPLIQYGGITGVWGTNLQVEYFYPAVYRKTLLQRAFSSIGYKISGEFLQSYDWNRAIIPFSNQRFQNSEAYAAQFVGSMSGVQLYQQTFGSPGALSVAQKLLMQTAVQDAFNSFSIFAATFTAEVSDRYLMRLSVDIANFQITQTGGSSLAESVLNLRATDQTGAIILNTQEILKLTGPGTANESGTFAFEFSWPATAGDELKAEFTFTHTAGSGATSVQYIAQFNTYTLACGGIDRDIEEGDFVELANNLPDMLVLDVIRDMVQANALIPTVDEYTQTVIFTRFSRMAVADPVDWSQKVSLNNTHLLRFQEAASGYGQNSVWGYSQESADLDPERQEMNETGQEVGRGVLAIGNQWLPAEVQVFQSAFEATAMVQAFSGIPNAYLPEISRIQYDGSLEDAGPRILYVEPDLSVLDLVLGASQIIQFEGTGYENIAAAYFYWPKSGGALDETAESLCYQNPSSVLNFAGEVAGTGLLAKNYREVGAILNAGQSIEVVVQLGEYEFATLDFTRPYFIETSFIRGYFFLDEVTAYEGSKKLCTAKLTLLP